MKSNTAVRDWLRTQDLVRPLPRLFAEWNYNRYADPVVSHPNEDDNALDPDIYPIESIIEPNRPGKGIAKARVEHGTASIKRFGENRPRYYLSDDEDIYKYWSSQTNADGNSNFASPPQPQVIYGRNIEVNKIVIGFENSWATPDAWTLQITTDGVGWSTIVTNPAIAGDGRATVYWNGTGWTSSRPADQSLTRTIRGIRIVVTSMGPGRNKDNTQAYYTGWDGNDYPTTGAWAYLEVIEMSARLEHNLSEWLMGVESNQDISDTSQATPIGTLTTNDGSLTLFNGQTANGSGIFDNSNPQSPYRNLMEPNVKFTLDWTYDLSRNGDGIYEQSVGEFVFYGGPWAGQKSGEVTVNLFDHSVYLQEVFPLQCMYEDLSVSEIVIRLCDSVGFNNYNIPRSGMDDDIIPIFWNDGTKNLWEIFDDLAKSTQSAIYFDATGVLRVRTRNNAFNKAASPVWNVRAKSEGSELADLIEYEQREEFEANRVKVTYQAVGWAPDTGLIPQLQKVWEPDGTTVLRSSNLTRNLDKGDNALWITQSEIAIWPYVGIVNIAGEIIRYEGKRYVYFTGNGGQIQNEKWVKSHDEKEALDALTPERQRYRNTFTGALNITERGLWNSEEVRHSVDAEGFSVRHIAGGTRRTGVGGFHHDRQQSIVNLVSSGGVSAPGDMLLATRGGEGDSPFYHYGVRLRFNPEAGRDSQRAGLVINNNGGNEDGYFIELKATDKIGAAERGQRNELIVYARKGGVEHRYGDGKTIRIVQGGWYDVDVTLKPIPGSHQISVWINGSKIITTNVPPAHSSTMGGKFGMFLRGNTNVSYEFIYGIARNEPDPPDNFSYLDRKLGGYMGAQWQREWVWRWRQNTKRKKKSTGRERSKWNQYYFDEFGPIVHEVREFEVNFDPAPVLYSRIYSSNDWNSIVTEYNGGPFKGKFIMSNTSRANAVVHGEDTLSYAGVVQTLNQVMNIFGKALVISDAETITVENPSAIRKRGKIETEINSPWVQTKSMAQAVADWIKDHWGTGSDEVEVSVFGNPLFELLDVVRVIHPEKSIDANFFVVGINNSWSNGIETTLRLRRIV